MNLRQSTNISQREIKVMIFNGTNCLQDSHKQLFLEMASQASLETLTSLLQHVMDITDSKQKITLDKDAFDSRFVEVRFS